MYNNKFKIAEFFHRESDRPKRRLIFMSCIGTFSFAMVVAVINEAAERAADASAEADARLFFMYLTVCAITLICKRYTLTQMTMIAEESVRRVRVRLTDKLRHTELQFLEQTEQGDIYARIAQDTDFISQSATDVVNVFESTFSTFFIFLYIAFISFTGFLLNIAFMLLLGVIFFFNYHKIKADLNTARMKEADFFDALNDTLAGFKEIKINTRKNNALFADIESLSRETERLKKNAGMKSNKNAMFALVSYEGLLGIVVFAVPLFSAAHSEVVTKLVASLIFIFGALPTLARGIPVILTMNVAVENLERLETSIDGFGAFKAVEARETPEDFREIGFHSVIFRYVGPEEETLFSVGPVDLNIRQGEILFIIGGNGSGKSTLMKLLTGLYYPIAGDGFITLDGQRVTPDNYQAYRELFSIIFTDFHLFRKLYGLESVDAQRVKQFLKEMDMHQKTDYADGRFTNIDLSRGQRKRLAYIAAILEDKPVYVFDEWAADQDPAFRRHFYEKFLEDLRAMNKTVIAVTHDDKYFDKADRVIKMEEGGIVESTMRY